MTRHPASGYFFLSPAGLARRGAFAPPREQPLPQGGGTSRRSPHGSRSRGRTGRGGSRSRLEFFGVAGRRHDGHTAYVFGDSDYHARGQLMSDRCSDG